MHCVGEYPTPDEHLHLSQIDFLRARYPSVRIGFSTHESPDHTDVVKLAVAKGVDAVRKARRPAHRPLSAQRLFGQSGTGARWLASARAARTICGVGDARLPPNPTEAASLRSLRRGVFARRSVGAGETIAGTRMSTSPFRRRPIN